MKLVNSERSTITFDQAPSANGVRLYVVGFRPVA